MKGAFEKGSDFQWFRLFRWIRASVGPPLQIFDPISQVVYFHAQRAHSVCKVALLAEQAADVFSLCLGFVCDQHLIRTDALGRSR